MGIPVEIATHARALLWDSTDLVNTKDSASWALSNQPSRLNSFIKFLWDLCQTKFFLGSLALTGLASA